VQRHVQMPKNKEGFPALSAPTRQERRRNAWGGGQDNVAIVVVSSGALVHTETTAR
jgi:hypothetical protein